MNPREQISCRRLMALSFIATLAAAGTAAAEPRFAMRLGQSCSTCHVNPSGGGMRNTYGSTVFETMMLPAKTAAPPSSARLGDSVAFGADLRLALIGQPNRQDDSNFDPVAAGLLVKTPTDVTFFPMQADLYLSAGLAEDITAYVDLGAQGSFEAFALVEDLPLGAHAKLGFFTPTYGIKLANHTAATRQSIGFDPRAKDAGLEVGIIGGLGEVQLGVFNGESSGSPIDTSQGLAVAARAAIRHSFGDLQTMLGASGYRDQSQGPGGATSTELRSGLFAGLSLGPLTYLGEVDLRRVADGSKPDGDGNPTVAGQLVSYQQLTYMPQQGVEFTATYEFMDRDTGEKQSPADVVHRFGGTISLFPVAFTEVDLMYRHYLSRADRADDGQHEVLVFGRLFF